MPNDRRRYELPGVEDLTKEQEQVLALPREGRHLVVGGPGTGKTVVCLLRARYHAQCNEAYQFLIWNHLLLRASRALFQGELRAFTWNSWFWRLFRQTFRKAPPTLEPTDGSNWRLMDWDAAAKLIDELPESEDEVLDFPRLVIDEGQDMPPGFYDCLNTLGFEDIFVAADQNQQINDENSSLKDLRHHLSAEEMNLTDNHRNSRLIARLAREFYTDRASSPPALPPLSSTIYVPRLYYVSENMMPRIARSILRHWDQDPRRLIGIIAPCNFVRENYFNNIRDVANGLQLDSGDPPIKTFYHGHNPEISFDRGGILVINAQNCKGLEFDLVVLADIEQYKTDNRDYLKKLFYVMVSRARQRVVMFMKRDSTSMIESLLPDDDSILLREDLVRGDASKEATA